MPDPTHSVQAAQAVQALSARLLARDPPPPLVPQTVLDPALTPEINALVAPSMTKAVLHLMNDDLASAHPFAQAAEGQGLADWAHAIIHRREGDYGNARYWFSRAASLPALAECYGPAGPAEFLDQCRRAGRGRDEALERRQRDEMAALLAAALKADH